MAHGGASRRVRRAAQVRLIAASMIRAVEAATARHERELVAWQARRIRVTARLLGIELQQVTLGSIIVCHLYHGVPPLADQAPRVRFDRRYGPRRSRWT